MNKPTISGILAILAFVLFTIAAVEAEYGNGMHWLVPGGLASFVLAFILN